MHVFNVKTGKTLEDELPAARYCQRRLCSRRRQASITRATDRQGTLLYQHVLGTRTSQDTLLFGREFRGEQLGGNDLFRRWVTDDGRYLVVRDRSRRAGQARGHRLPRPDQAGHARSSMLVWGLDSRFSAIYAKGAWYVKTDYQAPNGRILKADPGIMPDVWKTIVPEGPDVIEDWSIVGGKIYVKRLKDVKTGDHRSTRWTASRPARSTTTGSARPRDSKAGPRDRYGFYQLPVVHRAADHLPAGYGDRQARGLRPAEDSLRLQPI